MKPKTIGIVGGAGPQAGAYLLERIFTLSAVKYGCYRDADYPKVILISFPFSEMLCPEMEVNKLCQELQICLEQLRSNGASVLAIACNTLHIFLNGKEDLSDLVHLPRILVEEVSLQEALPLVFCTSTSKRFAIHQKFLPCVYPDEQTQQEVDGIIDQVLKGSEKMAIINRLQALIERQTAKTVILGCTELSIYAPQLSVPDKQIIDPLELMAQKVLQKSFNQ